jgi:hypothetical protein
MIRFTKRSFGVLVMSLALLSTLTPPAVAKPGGNAGASEACENGGYVHYAAATGTVFKNAGQCTQYVAQGNALVPLNALGRCRLEAIAAGFGLTTFTAIRVGTAGDNTWVSDESTLYCGFEGNDTVGGVGAGDLFLGGEGTDSVTSQYGGTFNGGDGDDSVTSLEGGTFNGGAGIDRVTQQTGGTFNGGAGDDYIVSQTGGTFNGGPGVDGGGYPGGTFNQE